MLKNVMVKDCSLDLTTVEREIASASHFFGDSCVPGKWAPDYPTDVELSTIIIMMSIKTIYHPNLLQRSN
jgi:hypothetical protein